MGVSSRRLAVWTGGALVFWMASGCGETSREAADGAPSADARTVDGGAAASDADRGDDAARAADAGAMVPADGATTSDAAPAADAAPEPDAAPASDAAPEPDAAPAADGGPAPPPCELGPDAPLVLLYASVGGDDNLRFLHDDCAAEVVVGEKRAAGPRSVMKRPAARAMGGRTGFVSDLFGRRIAEALRREDGVQRTAAEFRAILDAGYDYIIIDEITAAADWADGALVNQRFRRLLEVLPPRKVIAYVSLDLTMAADGGARMNDRRQLLYALLQRGRAIALEVYLHTGQVRAGQAPDALRRAAVRLRNAVLDLPGGGHVNRRAITVLGLSMHEPSPYDYLDDPRHDLAAVRTQARTLRTFGALLPEQRGIGYYFVSHSDIVPAAGAPYDFDDLIDVIAEEAHLSALAAGGE